MAQSWPANDEAQSVASPGTTLARMRHDFERAETILRGRFIDLRRAFNHDQLLWRRTIARWNADNSIKTNIDEFLNRSELDRFFHEPIIIDDGTKQETVLNGDVPKMALDRMAKTFARISELGQRSGATGEPNGTVSKVLLS